jgi:hypothetical protein
MRYQSHRYEQTTLDESVIRQPKVPQFTTNGLVDYMVELIVCEDKVTSFCRHMFSR